MDEKTSGSFLPQEIIVENVKTKLWKLYAKVSFYLCYGERGEVSSSMTLMQKLAAGTTVNLGKTVRNSNRYTQSLHTHRHTHTVVKTYGTGPHTFTHTNTHKHTHTHTHRARRDLKADLWCLGPVQTHSFLLYSPPWE